MSINTTKGVLPKIVKNPDTITWKYNKNGEPVKKIKGYGNTRLKADKEELHLKLDVKDKEGAPVKGDIVIRYDIVSPRPLTITTSQMEEKLSYELNAKIPMYTLQKTRKDLLQGSSCREFTNEIEEVLQTTFSKDYGIQPYNIYISPENGPKKPLQAIRSHINKQVEARIQKLDQKLENKIERIENGLKQYLNLEEQKKNFEKKIEQQKKLYKDYSQKTCEQDEKIKEKKNLLSNLENDLSSYKEKLSKFEEESNNLKDKYNYLLKINDFLTSVPNLKEFEGISLEKAIDDIADKEANRLVVTNPKYQDNSEYWHSVWQSIYKIGLKRADNDPNFSKDKQLTDYVSQAEIQDIMENTHKKIIRGEK